MEVRNPSLLPEELIRIAAYYCEQSRRPFALRAFVRDPFKTIDEYDGDLRKGTLAEYHHSGQVNLFLAKMFYGNRHLNDLPAGINIWFELLTDLLHEIGHHVQLADPEYRDDWDEFGYEDCWVERDAREFAFREIRRLATLDPYLFMPRRADEMGWAGQFVWKQLAFLRERVYETGSWMMANQLREARLHAIHIPKQMVDTIVLRALTPGELRAMCKKLGARYRYDEGLGQVVSVCPDFEQDETVPRDWAAPLSQAEIDQICLRMNCMVMFDEGTKQFMAYKSIKAPNPLVELTRTCGVAWHDKRGHEYLYLPPGWAVLAGRLPMQRGLMTDTSMAISRRARERYWARREAAVEERERLGHLSQAEPVEEFSFAVALDDIF